MLSHFSFLLKSLLVTAGGILPLEFVSDAAADIPSAHFDAMGFHIAAGSVSMELFKRIVAENVGYPVFGKLIHDPSFYNPAKAASRN